MSWLWWRWRRWGSTSWEAGFIYHTVCCWLPLLRPVAGGSLDRDQQVNGAAFAGITNVWNSSSAASQGMNNQHRFLKHGRCIASVPADSRSASVIAQFRPGRRISRVNSKAVHILDPQWRQVTWSCTRAKQGAERHQNASYNLSFMVKISENFLLLPLI